MGKTPRFRNWMFTEFNFDIDWDEKLKELASLEYYCVQKEKCPDTGRIHLQGYLELANGCTLTGLKKRLKKHMCWPSTHLDPRKGTQEQAVAYCTKDDSRIEGPWEWGKKNIQGERSDLIELRDAVLNGARLRDIYMNNELCPALAKYSKFYSMLVEDHQREQSKRFIEQEVIIVVGPAGTGKTRFIYEKHGYDNVYPLINAQKDIWFDGYEGQKVLLIDDFYGWIKWSFLLKLLDGHPCRLNVKGGTRWKTWTHVYITSNKHPKYWYPNKCPNGVIPNELLRRISSVLYFAECDPTLYPEVGGNTKTPTSRILEAKKELEKIPDIINGVQEENYTTNEEAIF